METPWWVRSAAVFLGGCLVMAAGGTAVAAPASPGFYDSPSPLPAGSPGEVLRSEAYSPMLSVPGQAGPWPAGATRIMYGSKNARGDLVPTTATYFDASLPWTGAGARPLVVLAPGTQGQGDQCAPSKVFGTTIHYEYPLDLMVGYEAFQAYALLSRGIDVVVTDYQGLGTPGLHSYGDRRAQAHAVLDAARAVKGMPGSRIGDDSPIGLWGYSQGGGAAGAAAELHAEYAPELNVRGAYVGAPPADLGAVAAALDGGLGVGFAGYAINSIYDGYLETRAELDGAMNPAGRAVLDEVANQCVPETILRYGMRDTSAWTRSGERLAALIDDLPNTRAVLDMQRLGRVGPRSPVLIVQGRNDDLVPLAASQQLADDWCGRGTTVQFAIEELPPIAPGFIVGHGIPLLTGIAPALDWMTARFDGAPAPSTCTP